MRGQETELPYEIIFTHILPRLPSKTLMRFKCVSKSWLRSITRDLSFIIQHKIFHNSFPQANTTTHLLFSSFDKNSSKQHFLSLHINEEPYNSSSSHPAHLLSLDSAYNHQHLQIQSSNGLFLCFHHPNMALSSPIYILNPSTRQLITLPICNPPLTNYERHVLATCSYHLGFNPCTNEYRVLGVFTLAPTMRFIFMILEVGFSSTNSTWRKIDPILPSDHDQDSWGFSNESVCINGGIHWLHWSEKVIVRFEVGDEEFRIIPFLHELVISSQHLHRDLFQVGDDCLGFMVISNDDNLSNERVMALWVVEINKRGDQRWRSYVFDLRDCLYYFAVGSMNSNEIVYRPLCTFWNPFWVLCYDMKRRSFRRVEVAELPNWFLLLDAVNLTVHVYKENIMFLGA